MNSAAITSCGPVGSRSRVISSFRLCWWISAQQAIFGNSPGKYIAGIRAIPTQPRERDFSFFVEREFKVLILGQAFGLKAG
jgi:hypothetical protein